MFGLTAPFSAALMDRFGVRRVMLVALATIAAGSSATTLMTEPWQYVLLWGIVVGSATGAVSVPLARHRREPLVLHPAAGSSPES